MTTTFTALTTLEGRLNAEKLGLALEAMEPAPTGVGVFELEDDSGVWEIGGYFLESPDPTQLAILAAAFGAKDFVVSEIPETDWVAHVKRELSPVEAGRYYVYGSHDADTLPAGKTGLLIEASMAFGTGHHGTTKGCLIALDRLVANGVTCTNILDLGCGTAVLAMAATKTWGVASFASDIDPVAVDVAVANVDANALAGQVHCLTADGLADARLEAAAPFDLIFANILKGPLILMAEDIYKATQLGGRAILSGILQEQEQDVIAHFTRFGYDLECTDRIGDWSILTLHKFR